MQIRRISDVDARQRDQRNDHRHQHGLQMPIVLSLGVQLALQMLVALSVARGAFVPGLQRCGKGGDFYVQLGNGLLQRVDLPPM